MIESTYKVECDFCGKDITYSTGHAYDSMVCVKYVIKSYEKERDYISLSTDKHPSENDREFCDIYCLKKYMEDK